MVYCILLRLVTWIGPALKPSCVLSKKHNFKVTTLSPKIAISEGSEINVVSDKGSGCYPS